MKKLTVVLILALAVVAVAAPSSAESSKSPVAFWEVSCLVDPGIEWVEDGVLHGRGRIVHAVLYDSVTFDVDGYDTVVSNINLDLATGEGSIFGTWSAVYLPESATGTFDGTYTAKIVFTATGVSAWGKAVGHGTGELRGMKMRLGLSSDPPPAQLLDVIAADNPCSPHPPAAIGYDAGFIHKPHGD